MVSNLDVFLPATPFGVMRMFEEYGIQLNGKMLLLLVHLILLEKPMASLLINAKATVILCV